MRRPVPPAPVRTAMAGASATVRRLPGRLGAEGGAVVLVLAVALVFRVVALTSSGFNSDEAVYAGQGAAMFGVDDLDRFFSLFRAHPLLLQAVVGLVYQVTGPSDLAGRLVAVTFGVGAIAFTWAAARELYGRRVALIAAAVCAVVPYHVLVSRQLLVDTALGCFVAFALFAVCRAVNEDRPAWVVAAAVGLGLATLSKETAVIFVPIAVVILLLARRRGRLRAPGIWLWSAVGYAVVVAPFPLTRLVASPANAQSFLLWQFTRGANHQADYFVRALLQFGTWPFALVALGGLVLLAVRHGEADVIVALWVVPPFVFYSAWPTKLFPYLFPILGGLAIAAAVAADTAFEWIRNRRRARRPGLSVGAVATVATLLFMAGTSVHAVAEPDGRRVAAANDFDIEIQTFAGVREFARWAQHQTPAQARFLTIGPSLGNILRFYGQRESVALSISPDPSKRNPAYIPVDNPDRALRQLSVQFVVWDAYSADRTTYYSERLLHYARRFGGIPVFTVYVDRGALREIAGEAPPGSDVRLIVYDVPGVSPTADEGGGG